MENSTMKTGNPVANEKDFQKVANKVSTNYWKRRSIPAQTFCRNCCAFQRDDQ